jgi:hypothetical protein
MNDEKSSKLNELLVQARDGKLEADEYADNVKFITSLFKRSIINRMDNDKASIVGFVKKQVIQKVKMGKLHVLMVQDILDNINDDITIDLAKYDHFLTESRENKTKSTLERVDFKIKNPTKNVTTIDEELIVLYEKLGLAGVIRALKILSFVEVE